MVKTTGIRSEIVPAVDMQLNEMPFLVLDEIHSHPDWLFTLSYCLLACHEQFGSLLKIWESWVIYTESDVTDQLTLHG